ncbi:PKD domain-containing protein, partial [Candidatus Woesearchaeota archaeon]|nr:PKD domain-containing protein [Candidatus Woesearchaeota archaeon]
LPVVNIIANSTAGYASLDVQFFANVTDGQVPFTFAWTFGDGNTSSEQNPTYTYTTAGTYTARVTVTDAYSRTASDSLSVTVFLPPPDTTPIAVASTDVSCGITPTTVQFSGNAMGGEGNILYTWNFGDGTSVEYTQNPQHVYYIPGIYVATLTVTDSDGDSGNATVTVNAQETDVLTVTGIDASATKGEAPLRVNFTATSAGGNCGVHYEWNFGDGVTSRGSTAEHTYINPGVYTVTLIASDNSGKTANATTVITVLEKVEEPLEATDLQLLRVYVDGMDKAVSAGEPLHVQVTMENKGPRDLKRMRITAMIPELGERAVSRYFTIANDERKSESTYLELPGNTPPGEYDVQITVSNNDEIKRIKHRAIMVE